MTSRTNDPDTSQTAAAAIEEQVPRLQLLILVELSTHAWGLTTRQLSQSLDIDFATISPRMRPMEEKGWVEMTPKKVKNPRGKGWGRVWVLTAAGRAVIL